MGSFLINFYCFSLFMKVMENSYCIDKWIWIVICCIYIFIWLITGAVTLKSIVFIYENLNIFWHKSGTPIFLQRITSKQNFTCYEIFWEKKIPLDFRSYIQNNRFIFTFTINPINFQVFFANLKKFSSKIQLRYSIFL